MSLYRKGMPTLLYISNKQLENVFKCHFQLSCIIKSEICCCSVTQYYPTLCDPMDCSMPGLPVPHHHLKFAQVHVHCFGDAFRSSQPLMFSSPSALNLSQPQEVF